MGIESSSDDLLEPGSQVTEVAGESVHAPSNSVAQENATDSPVPGKYYECCHCCGNSRFDIVTTIDDYELGHTTPCHIHKQCTCH